MKYDRLQTNKGFTLVETLVAITILLVAIVGPMTIASRGLQTAFFARDQIAAFYLAQEGVEYVRWVRDSNALQGNAWLSGLSACNSNNGCKFDMRNTSSVTACPASGNGCRLHYDPGSMNGSSNRGFYYHGSGSSNLTPFTRRMWINEIDNGREAEIIVEVSWDSGLFSNERVITTQSRIFNQYDSL